MFDAPSLKWNVYDPKDLTAEQLLTIMHIGPEHRIVDLGDKAIVVDWDAVMADGRIAKPDAWS